MRRYSALSLLRNGLAGNRHWQRAWRAPEPKRAYDVIIVGAGGHGLATAFYLAENHGIRNVAVLEKNYVGGGKIDPALGCMLSLAEGRMRLKLGGPHTLDILAACIAIDWNSPAALQGRAVQTSFHQVPVLALRSAADACDLILPRSFAQSLAEWVAEVAAPYEARSKVAV